MNLHIVPDSKFVNTFCDNLEELGLLDQNKIVVRTNADNLKRISRDLPYAALYSSKFKAQVGDTKQYQRVFIHLFSPLMYRWVAMNSFRELNWMVWGADLYNLPFIRQDFYGTITGRYVRKHRSFDDYLYLLKVWLTNMAFKNMAYAKVSNVLTWMDSEYKFACHYIPVLRARHGFFFYENQIPYEKLDKLVTRHEKKEHEVPSIIIGNSGYATNNHLEAIHYLEEQKIKANLLIPVSYGDAAYINFLKNSIDFYTQGRVEFIDSSMGFDEYLNFLSGADALYMNTIRPQGYGNIFMMLYLDKVVFLNELNISLPDLRKNGIVWNSIREPNPFSDKSGSSSNKAAIVDLLSHERLLKVYGKLFS